MIKRNGRRESVTSDTTVEHKKMVNERVTHELHSYLKNRQLTYADCGTKDYVAWMCQQAENGGKIDTLVELLSANAHCHSVEEEILTTYQPVALPKDFVELSEPVRDNKPDLGREIECKLEVL